MLHLKKIKQFLLTDFGIALLITLGWKVVMLAIGYVVNIQTHPGAGLLDHTIQWDSNWYLAVINGHYAANYATAAFYPLFPFLVYLVSIISFGSIDYPLAGQVVSTVSVWFALTAAIKIGRHVLGEKKRFWIVALLLSAPAAFFLHAFYSEALFIAISFWAYYFALQRKWMVVGVLLGVLTAVRLPSILIIALCSLELMQAYKWNIKKIINRNLLWFLFAPVGFIAFAIYLQFAQSDFLGMFHAYKATGDWSYQVFNPDIFETIAKAGYQIVRILEGLRPMNLDFIVNILVPLLSLGILFTSSVYLFVKHRDKYLPLGIVGLLSIIMFTLNSNVVSIHRYILPLLTVYLAIALFIKGRHQKAGLILACVIGTTIQIALYSLFVTGHFVG